MKQSGGMYIFLAWSKFHMNGSVNVVGMAIRLLRNAHINIYLTPEILTNFSIHITPAKVPAADDACRRTHAFCF